TCSPGNHRSIDAGPASAASITEGSVPQVPVAGPSVPSWRIRTPSGFTCPVTTTSAAVRRHVPDWGTPPHVTLRTVVRIVPVLSALTPAASGYATTPDRPYISALGNETMSSKVTGPTPSTSRVTSNQSVWAKSAYIVP